MAHPCQTKQQELESFLINVEETNLQITISTAKARNSENLSNSSGAQISLLAFRGRAMCPLET